MDLGKRKLQEVGEKLVHNEKQHNVILGRTHETGGYEGRIGKWEMHTKY
jgi:hypothetical protein